MHIEPGVVNGAKLALSYVTAAGAMAYGAKLAFDTIRHSGTAAFVARSAIATMLVFCFFQVLPHYPVGVSEVHLILATTLFLIFGAGPAAVGLALGLLAQGMLFVPADLPQYAMNITTLLVPLAIVGTVSRRIISPNTAYKDISYKQCLALSTAYQGGVVAWVGFWAFYGQGFGAANLESVGAFGAAYMSVIFIEPLVDLSVLAAAKSMHQLSGNKMFEPRLYRAVC